MPEIIDITLTLKEPMRGFRKTIAKSISEDGWNATDLHIYSHAGTHMDAPTHFNVSPATIDKIDPVRFISDCHIIHVPVGQDSEILGVDILGKKKDEIRENQSVIFQTGWSKYSDDQRVYRDKLPRIGEDLARWLVDRKINLIGVEPPSIADVNNLGELERIHRILLEANILILEGLTNLDQVKKDFVKLIALPLKIHSGDGAPVRALIVEEY